MSTKKNTPPKKAASKKISIPTKAPEKQVHDVDEEVSSIRKDQVEEVKEEIKSLSNELVQTTKSINNQNEYNELKKSIFQLSNSIQSLKQTSNMIYPAPESKDQDCGCGGKNGCDDIEKCCVQLFISRVRVTKAQNTGDADKLELIFAVRALDMCGLLPGLTSYLKIDKDAGWVPAYSPIGKFCVPCNGKLTIPLTAEAMETGERGEGRPEYGSAPGSITLTCDCEINPIVIPISLKGGGVGRGEVEVEISARKIDGGCC